MEPVNLMAMNTSDLKVFLDSFDHVFSDCDGVIWAKTPLPGAGEFFERMQQLGKTVHFVSNNSLRTRQNYEDLFTAANINQGFEKLTVPSTAIAEYLKSINFNKTVFCVTCPETMSVLQSYGFTCKYGPEVGSELYTNYIQYLEDDEDVGAVVFDSDFNVNLPKMYRAITYLARPDVLFISGATDRYVPLKPGSLSLGTGVFTDIVSEETKREPTLFGKPGKLFGEFAMKRAAVTDPSRVLFIGDMIEQDVGLGRATGFKTLLVLTNNTYEDMMAHQSLKPDYYADSLGSLVPVLNKV
ncbi:PREDICTED: phosphoglycolate phosphatase 1B, chloroplastic-like [Papilio polytes]|uniref:phosphoglycolate phosphatase 1B, chloroplastic-like n=1 Tax=Papilio polytes TaxID=76194 RepID=UPI0006762C73|nr:PREDICTED: phosphoglycolate phosphatase 1B, chloroplastic-like [Papilio polytes]